MNYMNDFASRLFGMADQDAERRLSESQRKQLNTRAWFDAGLALMAASGPRARPVGIGEALQYGVMAGRDRYGADSQAMQERMAAQAKAQQEEQFLAGLAPEQQHLARVLGVGPFAKQQATTQGQLAIEREKARLKPKETFRDLDPAEASRRGYDPTKAWQINEQTGRVMQVGGNGVQVTNNLPGAASPFAKALATQDAESFRGWRDAAMSAGNTLDQLQVIEQINGLQQGGKVGEAATIIGRYFGTDAAANQQIFDAAQKNLVLEQAKSLKGAMSDRDIELLESTLPRFGNDPRANAVILDILKRAANKTISNFEAAESNVAQKGDLQGFRPQMRATPATIPTNAAAVNLDALSADEIAAELRRRGIQ